MATTQTTTEANERGGDPILCPRCEGNPSAPHNGYEGCEYARIPGVEPIDQPATRTTIWGEHRRGRVTIRARYGMVPGSHGPDYYFVPEDGRALWWPYDLITLA